jgi:ribonuclease HI
MLARIRNGMYNEKVMDKNTDITIYTDGGSRGNPGPAACGIIMFDRNERLFNLNAKFLGNLTNNQAEYKGVITALRMAQGMGVKKVTFYLDSELIVKQLTGVYKIKSPNIASLKSTIDKLLTNFKSVTFKHIVRKYNTFADKLVNIVLDAHSSQ